MHFFGIPLGTAFQGATLATIIIAALTALGVWIKHGPDRIRAETEADSAERIDYAQQVKEFRFEVHGYKNMLAQVQSQLIASQSQSARRGDKLNMVLFILNMVMDRLHAKDPDDQVLAQAKVLLSRVQAEPYDKCESDVVHAAQETVQAAENTLHEVRAAEAKPT